MRNKYLLSFGITPIWFPKGSYDYVEQILRLARNELRYSGHEPVAQKNIEKQLSIAIENEQCITRKNGLVNVLNFFGFKK